MYRTGHYGAALLAYAPVGLLVAVAGFEPTAIVGGAISVGLSTLPDFDHRIPLIEHRGPTHTVLFAILVGAAVAAGAAALVGSAAPAFGAGLVGFGFVVGTLAVCSHLAADALTPMGIRPFWPITNRRYTLNVARASNPLANYLLFALGIFAVATAGAAVSTGLL